MSASSYGSGYAPVGGRVRLLFTVVRHPLEGNFWASRAYPYPDLLRCRMPVLVFTQRLGPVEPLVEVWVQVMGLVGEHRTKRAAVGRKPPVALVDVLAVGDRGRDGAVRVRRYARQNTGSVPPARGGAPVAKCPRSLRVLAIHESEHRFFHVPVIRRAEGISTWPSRSSSTAVGTASSLPSTLSNLLVTAPAPMVREKGISCMRKPRIWNQTKGWASHCATDEVDHDVSAARLVCTTAIVRQLGHNGAGDAAPRESQGCLLFGAQRLRSKGAVVGKRPPFRLMPWPKRRERRSRRAPIRGNGPSSRASLHGRLMTRWALLTLLRRPPSGLCHCA